MSSEAAGESARIANGKGALYGWPLRPANLSWSCFRSQNDLRGERMLPMRAHVASSPSALDSRHKQVEGARWRGNASGARLQPDAASRATAIIVSDSYGKSHEISTFLADY